MKTTPHTQKIIPFLWFDAKAEEAMKFYTSIFPNSKIDFMNKWPEGSPFPSTTVQNGCFTLDGTTFHAFDAGPMFQFNPSISFFVIFETGEEIDSVWKQLIDGGEAMMPLDTYPWSERYGWVTDRFGLSWQLMKGKLDDVGQRVTPLLMYSGDQRGNAEQALNQYMSIFKDSSLDGISRYEENEPGPEGLVNHAQCKLEGQTFMVMDNGTETEIPFNEAISFYVNCKDQAEVDHLWEALTKNGGSESQCGWLKDKYGVSWQIVPELVSDKLANGEPRRVKQLMEALWKMKKLDTGQLLTAYNQ